MKADAGTAVRLLKEVMGLVDSGSDDDGDVVMSPLPSPRSPGAVLLHRRYSVELHPDSVLSRDGLTCWVLIATDTAFDRRRVAIKMYKAKFAAISAQDGHEPPSLAQRPLQMGQARPDL